MNPKAIKDIDYGFRLNGKPVLFYKDRSLAADESTHQMEKALRQMSMEYYSLDRCLQCGICTCFCPNHLLRAGDPFSPRTFIQKTRLGLLDLSGDDLWMCTNCGHCQMVCPFEIPLLDVMASLRNLVIEQGAGHVPVSIKSSISSIASCGNPWKEETSGRVQWLRQTGIVPAAGKEETVHIFLGCLAGYDRRARKTAEAAMRILRAANVPFEILAEEEICCGDTVRRVGDFSTAEKVRKTNRDNFRKHNVRKLYVLSPHCFHTFHEMFGKETGAPVQVAPLLELVKDLLYGGCVVLDKFEHKRAAFHDPCFFSKHLDNMIDPPREILDRLDGIERVEMEHAGRKSLCCGGGGGGIWRDAKKGERLSEIRLDEALAVDADLLVTSCPYCLSMLEDARQGDDKYAKIEIVDMCELIGKGIRHEDH